jgi:hypothetical protein
VRLSDVKEKHEVPFFNVAEAAFSGVHGLLDDQVPAARRPAAVTRLRKYAGLEGGAPMTQLARAETTASFARPGLMAPAKIEIEKALQNGDVMVDGMEKLFAKYGVAGYEEPLRAFKQQLAEYQAWLRTEVLPRARTDFRLDPEVYAATLDEYGVDRKPEEIAGGSRAIGTCRAAITARCCAR